MNFCSNCGIKILSPSNFCTNCGSTLQFSLSNDKSEIKQRSNSNLAEFNSNETSEFIDEIYLVKN